MELVIWVENVNIQLKLNICYGKHYCILISQLLGESHILYLGKLRYKQSQIIQININNSGKKPNQVIKRILHRAELPHLLSLGFPFTLEFSVL